ncbi:MAG TPA: hypothetical protein DCY12_03815 [Candidatus Atribacteria bacterium]|nr:hypothetical protein [Candidatus Atribacteria bacterium]
MNKKTIPAIIFYVFCFFLFYFFTLLAREKGLISSEVDFYSNRAQIFFSSGAEQPKILFLTYPFLPFLFALIGYLPTLIPPVIGIFTIWLLSKMIIQKNLPPFFILLIIASPFFLLSLSYPSFFLLALFITITIVNIVQYHETQSIYFFFLAGISLGVGTLTQLSFLWAVIPVIIFQWFFFRDSLLRKTSLFLVSLFPPAFSLATILFFNWVFSGDPFLFLNTSSLNLKYYLPELLTSSSYNLPMFFSKLWFIYPFLGLLFFQGKVRIFWMISVIILSFILFQNQLLFLPISFLTIIGLLLWNKKSGYQLITGIIVFLLASGLGWYFFLNHQDSYFSAQGSNQKTLSPNQSIMQKTAHSDSLFFIHFGQDPFLSLSCE